MSVCWLGGGGTATMCSGWSAGVSRDREVLTSPHHPMYFCPVGTKEQREIISQAVRVVTAKAGLSSLPE